MKSPTILCADDERNVLLTLRDQLQRHFPDYSIEIAESGAEALELVAELTAAGVEVPLVIADQVMPQMKGDEFLIELHRRHADSLKVMMTGQTSMGDVGHAVNQANLYRCLSKPWHEADLQHMVTEALQHYRQKQQAQHQMLELEQANRDLATVNADLNQQLQDCRQELQHVQQQLQLFVEHSPAAVAMLDRDMRYVLTSRRWTTDYGLGEASMIGRCHYEVFPEIPERWKAVHRRCLAGAVERAEEDFFVRADGSVNWNQWEIHPWYMDGGEVGGIIIFTQVITERKLAQLALQESEERNRAILSTVPDLMTVISADGYYLDSSFNQFSGQIRPLQIGAHVSEVLPPEAAQACLAAIRQAIQSGQTQTHEQQIRFGDRIQYEEMRIVPFKADRVLCMVREITERRQTDLELQRREVQLSAIASNVPGGVFRLIRYANGAYAGLFASEGHRSLCGMTPERLQVEPDLFLTMVHPEDREEHVADWNAALQNSAAFRRESRYVLATGEVKWVAIRAQFQRQSNGDVIIDGLAFDVTERKQIELEIIQSRDLREAIFNESADALFLVDPATLLTLDCNKRAVELFEAEDQAALTNIAGHTLQAQLFTDAELEQIAAQIVTQGFWSCELEYVTLRGNRFWGNIAASRINVAGQSLNLVRVTDISERKRTETQLAAQNLLLSRIAQGEPLAEILQAVILQTEQQLPGAIGAVLLLDQTDRLWYAAAPHLPSAYARALDGVQAGSGVGACDLAACLKQPVICADVAADPRWQNYREFTLAQNLRACWAMPIVAADERVLGTFSVYYTEARTPQANELDLIQQVVKLVGIAIERDQAAAKIRHGQEQLQLTLNFARIGAWSWHPVTGNYEWNGQMVELLELPSGLPNMFEAWSERIHPDDLDRVQTNMQTALADRSAFAEEYRYRVQNGDFVWRWVQGQGIYTETGELERVLGIVQDITERKRVEETLSTIESQQRSVLENIPGFVAKVDRAGTILFLNRTAPGFTMAEVVGRKLNEFTAPESQQAQQEALDQVFATGSAVMIETLGTGAHQAPAYYEVRIAPLYHDGQVEAAILVTTDVTARKQVELALRQSEAKQRALISALPDLIMRISGDGVYLDFFAPNGPSTIGKTGDFVGTRVDESLPPDLAERRIRAIRAALQTGELQVYEQEIIVNGTLQIEECRVVVCGDNQVLLIGRNISDRKQAELALRESETLFRQLAETVREGFFVGDPITFSYTYVNPAYEAITGFSASEIYANSRHWLDSIHPADRERIEAALYQEFQGQPFDQEYRFIRPDGQELWLRSQAFPICDPAGLPIRIVGVSEDITGRKQTEAALRASEERRRLALDLTATGSWEFMAATGAAIWSDSHYRLMGLTPGEQPSNYQTWRDRVHPEDLEWFERVFNQALTSHTLLDIEYRVLYPDGTVRWVLTKGQGIYDPEGQTTRMLGVMVDVTDRKLAEQTLQRLNEDLELRVQQRTQDLLVSQIQLQAKEQFLRGVFEGTSNPIFVIDVLEHGRLEYTGWNRACELISGISAADVVGKSPQQVFPGEVGATIENNYRRCFETGQMVRYEEYLSFETGGAWTLTTLTPLRNAENRVYQIVGSAFDISERKRAEIALQEAQRFTQSIVDNTPNIIYIYDLENSCNLYANREVFEVLGYTPEAIQSMGAQFLEVVAHPDHLTELTQLQERIQTLADGEMLEVEYRMRHKDGTWHWLYDRISAFKRDASGDIVQYIGTAQDITDRKQAEAALAEKNAILQSVIECTPDVVYVKDIQGRYVIVNSGFTDFFDQPAHQLLGRTDAELLPAATAVQIHENDRSTIQLGIPQTIEEVVPRPDGTVRVYLTTKSPWIVPQGELLGVIGLARDITERKQAEQALFESEQRYATLAAAVPVGIYRTSLSGDCLYVNQRWCEIAGLTVREAMGKGWLRALHPDDNEMIAQSWSQFVQTGIPFQLEYRFRRPDDSVTWVFGQAIQELDETGEVKGYVGTITDISDRKRAEAQLREQEQFLRSIYEGVQQPMFVGDVLPDNTIRIASWNPCTARLAGMSNAEVAGKTVAEIFPPDQAAEMLARYAQSITTRQPAVFEEQITFQGQTHWMLSTYNPLINSEGRVHRVVGTVYDITERKQLEQELLQINAELEQRVAERTQDLQQAMEAAQAASRAKTSFLANMSHELRTPLNAILGFSQLLNRDSTLNPDQQEQIEIINRSGEHLLALINDVLTMSKIEAGQTTLSVNQFKLRDLLRDLKALFQLKAEAKQLMLTIQIDANLPDLIQTDESKLRQVLINLVGNAIKFTAQGSVTIRVWSEAVIAQNCSNPASALPLRLHFEVEDTGPGIAPEEQNKVFEPFGQTQTGRNSQEGTGLGLPISRQFVQLMGGELSFTTVLNQRTTFHFTIVVEPIAIGHWLSSREVLRVVGLAADQPSYRLLVVENKSDSQRFLVELLEAVGFEVQAAANGQEAVDLWQTWAPDLIWMDMRMPVMDGYTATKQIRRLEQQAAATGEPRQPGAMARPTTKILALTASAFEDDRALILAAGCDDVLFKPVTEVALFNKIAQHLGVRYRYLEESDPQAVLQPAQPVEELRNLPSEWVAQLRYAARTADEDLILNVIDQLPPTAAPLAAALKDLVNTLQIEKLIELTREQEGDKNAGPD